MWEFSAFVLAMMICIYCVLNMNIPPQLYNRRVRPLRNWFSNVFSTNEWNHVLDGGNFVSNLSNKWVYTNHNCVELNMCISGPYGINRCYLSFISWFFITKVGWKNNLPVICVCRFFNGHSNGETTVKLLCTNNEYINCKPCQITEKFFNS